MLAATTCVGKIRDSEARIGPRDDARGGVRNSRKRNSDANEKGNRAAVRRMRGATIDPTPVPANSGPDAVTKERFTPQSGSGWFPPVAMVTPMTAPQDRFEYSLASGPGRPKPKVCRVLLRQGAVAALAGMAAIEPIHASGQAEFFSRAPGIEMADFPNIIVITGDDLRWDHVAANGNEVIIALDMLSVPQTNGNQGTSLLAVMSGKKGARPESHAGLTNRMIRTKRAKYWIEGNGEEALFDYSIDPDELRNVAQATAHRALLDEMRVSLLKKLIAARDPLPQRIRPY